MMVKSDMRLVMSCVLADEIQNYVTLSAVEACHLMHLTGGSTPLTLTLVLSEFPFQQPAEESYTRNTWKKRLEGKHRYRNQRWKNQRNSEFFKLGGRKRWGDSGVMSIYGALNESIDWGERKAE